MSGRTPVAFDIETSGLDPEAVVTVAGFGHDGEEVTFRPNSDHATDR